MAIKLFAPGPDPRRTGRLAGARNRFAAAFLRDFLKDWQENGADAIKILRYEHPDRYVAIAASILPKEFTVETIASELDDAELELVIAELREQRAKLEQPKMIEAKIDDRDAVTAS